MRLTTDFFASSLLRRVRSGGGFAYLVRRGAHDAGTLFILVHGEGGLVDLYGPAPQSLYGDRDMLDERLFVRLVCAACLEKAQNLLEKELKFDPDIWLVEIENTGIDMKHLINLTDEGMFD